MTLEHPSARRGVVGGAFAFVGGVLFLASAALMPSLGILSYASFACFIAGLAILFTNAADTIDIDKGAGTIRYRTTEFIGSKGGTYPLSRAARIELREPLMRAELASLETHMGHPHPALLEAFLVFSDGTRIPIDYEHRANDPAESIAERVARFLSLPLQDAAAARGGHRATEPGTR